LVRDAAQQAQPRVSSAFQKVSDLFDDLLAGNHIDPQRLGSVAKDAFQEFRAWQMGGGYTNYHPPMANESDIHDSDPAFAGSRDPRQRARYRPGFHQEEEVPIDDAAQLAAARAKARQVMGFGPRDLITKDILKARYRKLAKKHHPDLGGSPARMREINDANEILEKAIP
jgi:hypothetical protein